MTVDELSRIANRLRLDVVETVHDAGDGHPGPCMSIADIMAVLFFEEMKLDARFFTRRLRARATFRLRN